MKLQRWRIIQGISTLAPYERLDIMKEMIRYCTTCGRVKRFMTIGDGSVICERCADWYELSRTSAPVEEPKK